MDDLAVAPQVEGGWGHRACRKRASLSFAENVSIAAESEERLGPHLHIVDVWAERWETPFGVKNAVSGLGLRGPGFEGEE